MGSFIDLRDDIEKEEGEEVEGEREMIREEEKNARWKGMKDTVKKWKTVVWKV